MHLKPSAVSIYEDTRNHKPTFTFTYQLPRRTTTWRWYALFKR